MSAKEGKLLHRCKDSALFMVRAVVVAKVLED